MRLISEKSDEKVFHYAKRDVMWAKNIYIFDGQGKIRYQNGNSAKK